MDYKEKYEQALSKARQFSEHPLQEDSAGIVEYIFPELKESEDERIRKELITWLQNIEGQVLPIDRYNAALSWIEKQGEQKPAEWSEEDDGFLNLLFAIFTNEHPNGVFSTDNITVFKGNCVTSNRIIAWLKSIKNRVQPKQEWSEEDEQYLLVCKNALVKYQTTDKWDAHIISHWLEDKLKSLKGRVQPQPH